MVDGEALASITILCGTNQASSSEDDFVLTSSTAVQKERTIFDAWSHLGRHSSGINPAPARQSSPLGFFPNPDANTSTVGTPSAEPDLNSKLGTEIEASRTGSSYTVSVKSNQQRGGFAILNESGFVIHARKISQRGPRSEKNG